MRPPPRSGLPALVLRYLPAAVAAAAAVLLRIQLQHWIAPQTPFFLSILAVAASAALWGAGPALAAMALSLAGVVYFIIPPAAAWTGKPPDTGLRALVFCFASSALVWIISYLSRGRALAKQAQAQAEEAERRFHELAGNIRDVFYLAHPRSRSILYLSPAFEEIWGRACSEFYADARKLLEAAHPADRDRIRDMILRQTRGERTSVEYRIVRPDGGIRWISDRGFPVTDGSGRVAGIASDITGRKLADEQLRSELTFRQATEAAMPAGITVVDERGCLTYVNPAFSRMVGWSPEELTGCGHPFPYWAPEEVPAITAALQATLRGEAPPDGFTLRFVRRNGERFEVNLVPAPMVSPEGERRWLASITDVSARAASERALRQTKDMLETLMATTPLALIAVDLEGRVQYWNPTAERMFGWSREEVLGRFVPFIPAEQQAQFAELLLRYRTGYQLAGMETRRLRKDGTSLEAGVWTAPLRDAEGRITGTLGIFADITERKQLEAQLRQTQKLESIGVLAGGVAHDFNNLLTGILGNASLALDLAPPLPELHQRLEDVVKASERAADLTRQLLAYAGKGRFVIQPVDLSAAVREIGALIQTSIPRRVSVSLDLADGLPAVEGDSGQLQQIIMNLVINAAEAMGDQSGRVTVRTWLADVTAEMTRDLLPSGSVQPGPYLALEVTDTGSGMDEAVLGRIFDPFFTTKFTGRGLGLAATLGIVRGHRGGIRVESAPGRGSRFTVLLPAAAAPAKPAFPSVPVPFNGSNRGLVLVIDDEAMVRRAATATLERFGYRVVAAEDGPAGVAAFRRQAAEISAVLLDLTMPGMDGEEVLDELRRIRANVPVLLSSGYDESDAMSRFDGKGLAGFLQKPYSATRLAEKVHGAVTPPGAVHHSGL